MTSPGSVLHELPEGARVCVFRALQLGDLLCAVPALRALREAAPKAEITLVGLPWARSFVRRFSSLVDEFVEFRGYPGLPEQPVQTGRIPGFLADLQARRFDLAIQLHGSGIITNPLVASIGAARIAGFYAPGGYNPSPETFLPYPDREPEIRRLLRLINALGASSHDERIEFPLLEEDLASYDALVAGGMAPSGPYVCIHPGARDPMRRWSPAAFSAVGDWCTANGLRVVITGSDGERELAGRVAGLMRTPAQDLSGRTDLGTLAALLSGARLVVSNDTGVAHLANALHVPSVTVFTASDPRRWAAADSSRHVSLGAGSGPCRHEGCRAGRCEVPVAEHEVVRAAESLLAGEPALAA